MLKAFMDNAATSSKRKKYEHYVVIRQTCLVSSYESSSDESLNGSEDEQENCVPNLNGGFSSTSLLDVSNIPYTPTSTTITVPTKKNPPRGQNKCAKLPSNEKTVVRVNTDGQPVGKRQRKLSSYLGILARDLKLVPFDVEDWRKFMTEEKKDVFWKIILTRFTFEGQVSPKSWAIEKMNHCFRSWRRKLKKRHYDTVNKPLKELLKPPNSRVDPDQWQNMVLKWESDVGKACSQRNLENRMNSTLAHHLGTKTIARLREEMTKDGKEPDRMTLFEAAYGNAIEQPVDPSFAQKNAEMNEEYEKLPSDCDKLSEWEKIFERIVGGDKRGYKRLCGIGVKTLYTSSSKQKAQEALLLVENEVEKRRALEEEITSEKQKQVELEEEVAAQAEKNSQLEEAMENEKREREKLENEMCTLKEMVLQLHSTSPMR